MPTLPRTRVRAAISPELTLLILSVMVLARPAQSESLLAAQARPTQNVQRAAIDAHRPGILRTAGHRSRHGLLALYAFREGSGAVVHDTSRLEPPLDLVIQSPDDARWIEVDPRSGRIAGLAFDSPGRARSPEPAAKVNRAIAQSGAMTLEAWLSPAQAEQEGPARIVTISLDSGIRNVTLGHGRWGSQPQTLYDLRLRTSATDPNGSGSLMTPAGVTRAGLQHVVFTRERDGRRRFYVDGELVSEDRRGGDLSSWDVSYPLLLGNEAQIERPWLGSFHLVALFGRALMPGEVASHYAAGPAPVVLPPDFEAVWQALLPLLWHR